MASTNKCEYCGSTITSSDQSCPNCGATNPLYVVDMPRTVTDPKTIEELQEYCAERGMPLLRMRFFIGQDCREAKAFGIYRDGSEYVVYKNKSDGSRAERYRGPDEQHAVREIFAKLLDECHNRGIYPDGKPQSRNASYTDGNGAASGNRGFGGSSGNGGGKLFRTIIIIIVIIVIIKAISGGSGGSSGYYGGGGGYSSDYYYDDNNYYDNSYYDNNSSSSYDHYNDSSWSSDYNDSSSSWWSNDNDSSSSWWSSDDDDWGSSSWDNDWDSGWDDWDSGGTDWDSDW